MATPLNPLEVVIRNYRTLRNTGSVPTEERKSSSYWIKPRYCIKLMFQVLLTGVDIDVVEASNYSKTQSYLNDTCDACSLDAYRTRMEHPIGYDGDLASTYTLITLSCGVSAAPFWLRQLSWGKESLCVEGYCTPYKSAGKWYMY